MKYHNYRWESLNTTDIVSCEGVILLHDPNLSAIPPCNIYNNRNMKVKNDFSLK